MKIDFVVTWVNDQDPLWLKEKSEYAPQNGDLNQKNRFIDRGFFKYWFRAIEKYAPWVNKVFIVTSGHLPEWLDLNYKKIIHVKHSDYIPKEYLPTFNSNTIELNLHRIDQLSEHFVLFNDDVFLNDYTTSDDFFQNGFPRDVGVYDILIPDGLFSNTVFNDIRIINKHFKKQFNKNNFFKFFNYKYKTQILKTIMTLPWSRIPGFLDLHVTNSFLKTTFYEVWAEEKSVLHHTSLHKFRETTDVNQWLMRYWQIEKNLFIPQKIDFGKMYSLDQIENILKSIKREKNKVICLNEPADSEKDLLEESAKIRSEFEKKFPLKSRFEK